MSDSPGRPAHQAAITVYCTQCGQAMLVAREHVNVQVACPHCRTTLEPWRVAGDTPPTAPPHVGRAFHYPEGISWRSRWIAGVLGVLLGPLGVHRFYLGFTGIGVLQIVLTFLTFGVAGVWGFIEGILCLVSGQWRDVDGLPLRE